MPAPRLGIAARWLDPIPVAIMHPTTNARHLPRCQVETHDRRDAIDIERHPFTGNAQSETLGGSRGICSCVWTADSGAALSSWKHGPRSGISQTRNHGEKTARGVGRSTARLQEARRSRTALCERERQHTQSWFEQTMHGISANVTQAQVVTASVGVPQLQLQIGVPTFRLP